MTEMEKAIMHRMPVGACMLFDQNAIQHGKPSPAYVEIDRIKKDERERLQNSIKRVNAEAQEAEPIRPPAKGMTSRSLFGALGIEIPNISVYRYLLALKAVGNKTGAIKVLKERKWITSDRTLYGGSGIIAVSEKAKEAGYVDDAGAITPMAMKMLDPYLLTARQGVNAGSEEHMALMRKVIEMIQNDGDFAFVLPDRESFDVGRLHKSRVKGSWDPYRMTAYEIQTNAVRNEISKCIRKAQENKYELIFVTNSHKVKMQIDDFTRGEFKVLILKPYETSNA